MKVRPWPVLLLVALQLLTPALTILGGVKHLMVGLGTSEILQFFALPLAFALAIFFVGRMTLILLIAASFWDIALLALAWRLGNLEIVGARLICDLVSVVFYFSWLQKIARPSTWQAKPRFRVRLEAFLSADSIPTQVRAAIFNVSEGGVAVSPLLEGPAPELPLGTRMNVKFKLLEEEFALPGEIVHHAGHDRSYGVRFLFRYSADDLRARRALRRSVQKLEQQGFERCGRSVQTNEFQLWLDYLVEEEHRQGPSGPGPGTGPGPRPGRS